MTSAVQFLRGWFAEPPPPFELRQPNPRWSNTRPREALRRLRIAAVAGLNDLEGGQVPIWIRVADDIDRISHGRLGR